jgi:hypothetical protein
MQDDAPSTTKPSSSTDAGGAQSAEPRVCQSPKNLTVHDWIQGRGPRHLSAKEQADLLYEYYHSSDSGMGATAAIHGSGHEAMKSKYKK